MTVMHPACMLQYTLYSVLHVQLMDNTVQITASYPVHAGSRRRVRKKDYGEVCRE